MQYLLIDGNSVLHAAQDTPTLTVGDVEVQAIFTMLKTMQKLLRQFPGHKPIVLWDGRAQWRYDLYPQYKSNRDSDPEKAASRESVRQQRPEIQRALTMLGVTQVVDSRCEADDLAAYFSDKLTIHGKVKLITGDKDWVQLVNKDVSWYCHRTDRVCTFENFEEFSGFKDAKQFLEAKALIGDTSDFIPPVGGIGKETVRKFLDDWGGVSGFYRVVDSPATRPAKLGAVLERFANNEAPKDSSKYGKMLPMRDAFDRNMKLMKLGDYVPSRETLVMTISNVNVEEFRGFCQEYLFRSITAQLSSWVEPFQKLKEV